MFAKESSIYLHINITQLPYCGAMTVGIFKKIMQNVHTFTHSQIITG